MAAPRGFRLLAASAAALAATMLALPLLTAPAAAQEHEVGHWMGLHHTFNRRPAARGPKIAGNFKDTADGDTSSFPPPPPPTQRFREVPPSHPFYADLPKPPGKLAGQAPGAAPKVFGYNGANGAYSLETPMTKPPGPKDITAKGTPGSAPYHQPKSFQIISPGKSR